MFNPAEYDDHKRRKCHIDKAYEEKDKDEIKLYSGDRIRLIVPFNISRSTIEYITENVGTGE